MEGRGKEREREEEEKRRKERIKEGGGSRTKVWKTGPFCVLRALEG